MSKPNRASPTLPRRNTMANRPPITAALDLTSDLLDALKKAGPNERGNYSLGYGCMAK
jgi:hypothetical protein